MTSMVAATIALRTGSTEAPERGLADYLRACMPVDDWRDVLIGLAPLHDCARRLGLDPAVVFDKVARTVPEEVVSACFGLGKRTDVTPKAFGYQVVDELHGPAYRLGPVGPG